MDALITWKFLQISVTPREFSLISEVLYECKSKDFQYGGASSSLYYITRSKYFQYAKFWLHYTFILLPLFHSFDYFYLKFDHSPYSFSSKYLIYFDLLY
jgi:hypothetical protein